MGLGLPEEVSERVAELVARLDELTLTSAKECPLCGHKRWRLLGDTLRVDRAEMLAYYCRRCGFMRFHYVVPFDVATRTIEEKES
jgi:DNA-directed RNA polymerase subunit RPC12/RpoP